MGHARYEGTSNIVAWERRMKPPHPLKEEKEE
jgi:hypothetical protein